MSPSPRSYREFAESLVAGGILSDPWLEGRERFRQAPVLLAPEEQAALYQAAEEIASAYNEMVRLCAADQALTERFFLLSPWQKLMWEAEAPRWHGIARADVFFSHGAPVVCELNCDTPSGEAETVLLGQMAAREHPGCEDPSAELEPRFCAMIEALADTITADTRRRPGAPLAIGIVYPTELTEDLSMIQLYRGWFEKRGWRAALGSPYNLRSHGSHGVSLFGMRCDVVVRHYKTDWWGERLPVWHDDLAFPDAQPLREPLCTLLGSAMRRGCAVVNPFASMLPQNKRSMALMWEESARFSEAARRAISRYLPETRRLETMSDETLAAEKDAWVLKSDYGCEGAEVIIGKLTPPPMWEDALRSAVRTRWVAQRYFDTDENAEAETTNHGVYLVAGQACGIFSRLSQGPTDRHALTAPTLVRRPFPCP
jgi:glutathionylspermidine synthase